MKNDNKINKALIKFEKRLQDKQARELEKELNKLLGGKRL